MASEIAVLQEAMGKKKNMLHLCFNTKAPHGAQLVFAYILEQTKVSNMFVFKCLKVTSLNNADTGQWCRMIVSEAQER